MCGITGFVDYSQQSSADVLGRMVATQKHRGPDDCGIKLYAVSDALVGLGQTRLSIIDLSAGGHQPMEFKALAIVFNGEIYNYREIKQELKVLGHHFVSTSDTEMILHAFHEWGTKCVERFIGMFAFVICDQKAQKIYAFRDRAGVKPFYYFKKERVLIFGSELKPIMQHPSFEKKIDRNALRLYFDYGYIPAPYSIFKHTFKLESGSYLVYDLQQNHIKEKKYWDPVSYYKKPKFDISYDDAKNELQELLKSAFQYRLVSDVPVGLFLSGGYDSTAVAAILQNQNTTKLKTFTIGFEEGNNEAPFAKKTADYLGTHHHEYTCTTKEAQEIIPTLPYYYDEPFADSSAIPTMLVSRFAKEYVTVALSADAGDELFAGYHTYPDLLRKLKLINQIPGKFKQPFATIFSAISSVIPITRPALKHKLQGVSRALNEDRFEEARDLFRIAKCLPEEYTSRVFSFKADPISAEFELDTNGFHHEIEVAMAIDYQSYLQNDILTKVDRATMSVSLEGRDPLVDHRLLEFAAQIPFEYKYDGISTKRILKDIVHEYVPAEMMNRPKTGFTLPISNWLRSDLSYLLDEYLNEKRLLESNLFNTEFLLNQIDLFKKKKLHYVPFIWKLLMFHMWYDRWMR